MTFSTNSFNLVRTSGSSVKRKKMQVSVRQGCYRFKFSLVY